MKCVTISCIGVVTLLTMASPASFAQMGTETNESAARAVVDAKGDLRVPANYRISYKFLGSWAVASGTSKTPDQLHVVYASPGTIDTYRKDKRFPDGSVLVKEVFQTTTGKMTTGEVSRAQTLKGWFVMVKESKNTHPDNALWGDGWAWSWFDAGDPLKTTSTNYSVECRPCHVPARANDWIYVQGYPPLEAH